MRYENLKRVVLQSEIIIQNGVILCNYGLLSVHGRRFRIPTLSNFDTVEKRRVKATNEEDEEDKEAGGLALFASNPA